MVGEDPPLELQGEVHVRLTRAEVAVEVEEGALGQQIGGGHVVEYIQEILDNSPSEVNCALIQTNNTDKKTSIETLLILDISNHINC